MDGDTLIENSTVKEQDKVFEVKVQYRELGIAYYEAQSADLLKEKLEEQFKKRELPEYKILSIEKVADSMDEFKSIQALEATPTQTKH